MCRAGTNNLVAALRRHAPRPARPLTTRAITTDASDITRTPGPWAGTLAGALAGAPYGLPVRADSGIESVPSEGNLAGTRFGPGDQVVASVTNPS
jgi:hypothetical protein